MTQLDENVSRFMQAQNKARKLIQMDSKGTLDSYKNKAMQEGRMSYNSNGEVTITPSSTSNYNTQSFQGVPQMSSSNSKLPKEILESFKTQPSVGMGMISEGSVLDVVNNMSNNQLFEEKHSVHEQVPMSSQSNVVNSSTVDYSMIKMIVEDCMKKYMSALKKSVLNEQRGNNNGTLQAMKIGDKFSFITNTGDLYEAELKFIKNIKTKKSGN